MKKRKKDIIHIFTKGPKQPSKNLTEEIIQSNKDLLHELFKGKIPRKDLRLKIEQKLAYWQFKKYFDDEIEYLRLFRISLLIKFENIQQSINMPNISNDDR